MLRIIIATVTFLILDAIWLGLLAKQMYIDAYGNLLRMSGGSMQPLWPAAVVVYIALIAGLVVFVIPKANGQLLPALLWGALFGFVTYATYDFTSLAVLANWSLKVSIIDTFWGMFICGITSFVTVLLTR